MRRPIIYKITNKINNKIYIGSTVKTFPQRWAGHTFASRKGSGSIFQRAIKKYGRENFEVEIICSVLDKKYLDDVEQFFIEYYQSMKPKGYNAVGVLKGSRDLITEVMKKEWSNPESRQNRVEKMIEGSQHRFEPIVSVHIQTAEVKYYESVHAAIRDGVAVSAIYFCLNGSGKNGKKDKTGQKRCWFRKEEGLTDQDYQNKASELIGGFRTDFTIPIIATNIKTNIEREFKNVYECSEFLNIKVKNIRRHIKGDVGYNNHVKGYKFRYK